MPEHNQRFDDLLRYLTASLLSDLSIGKRELFVRDESGRMVPLSELAKQNSARERIIILGPR